MKTRQGEQPNATFLHSMSISQHIVMTLLKSTLSKRKLGVSVRMLYAVKKKRKQMADDKVSLPYAQFSGYEKGIGWRALGSKS